MSALTFRIATRNDLQAVLELLADDDLAKSREHLATNSEKYDLAFETMESEHYNHVLLAEQGGRIVAALQLVFMPGLSRGGTKRAIIEAVRVASGLRGKNIGTALMQEAMRRAKEGGCGLVQLTSDIRRARAHLFYRRLGFVQSHYGFKKEL